MEVLGVLYDERVLQPTIMDGGLGCLQNECVLITDGGLVCPVAHTAMRGFR